MEPLQPTMILMEAVFVLTLMRALLVAAKMVPPLCGKCGLQMERRSMGEPVCRCGLGKPS
jgi:hypothetical protein